ncbi:MAG: NUDIX hydrolase [Clostridia bacterium]|nr:NUDIX hydrolase [Clostridia bacterium]
MNLEEKTLREEYKFKGRILNTRVDDVLLPDGSESKREVVEHNGGVTVVALTDNDEVYLVKQFRYPYKQVIYEIPAGKRDGNEDPMQGALRELKEETGTTADTVIPLGELYPSPGYCGEIIYMFAAKGLHEGYNKLDNGEFLEAEKFPLETVVDMILSGEIKDAKTQTAVLKVAEMKRRGEF